MQTLKAENIVVLPHRERVKAALISNAHLFDQRRHERVGRLVDRNLGVELNSKFS